MSKWVKAIVLTNPVTQKMGSLKRTLKWIGADNGVMVTKSALVLAGNKQVKNVSNHMMVAKLKNYLRGIIIILGLTEKSAISLLVTMSSWEGDIQIVTGAINVQFQKMLALENANILWVVHPLEYTISKRK
jgi:hypothetical protein